MPIVFDMIHGNLRSDVIVVPTRVYFPAFPLAQGGLGQGVKRYSSVVGGVCEYLKRMESCSAANFEIHLLKQTRGEIFTFSTVRPAESACMCSKY